MALSDDNGIVMPVSPINNGGFGSSGNCGDGWWIILLFILLCNGGWNNGFNGNNGSNGLYPWMNQANLTSEGFQNQMLNDNVTSIRDGIGGLSTQLCDGFGGVQMALANGFAGVEAGANAREIANMQNAFAMQTAMNQGFNGVNSTLAQCCCDNKAGLADLRYTVATENCADRQVVSDGIRDLLANQTANTQRILDQLCNDKIDAKNDTIAQLRQELLYARGQASQDVQTATLRQGQIQEIDDLYNRLSNCPIPSTPVYGRTPIFTCNNNGCGCGCGNF